MKSLLLLFPLLSLVMSSCTENPTGNVSGTVWGYVDLVDQDGFPVADQSGATVSLVGTNFTTITGADGTFRFENLSPGVYEIKFEKDGYGWLKRPFQFVGNGEYFLGFYGLPQIPSFTISELDFNISSDPQRLVFSGKISESAPEGRKRAVYLFFSLEPSGPTELTRETFWGEVETMGYNDSLYGYVYTNTFLNKKIPSGTRIYFRAYPRGYSWSTYFDIMKRTDYYTSLPETGTQVMSFVLP